MIWEQDGSHFGVMERGQKQRLAVGHWIGEVLNHALAEVELVETALMVCNQAGVFGSLEKESNGGVG